MSLVLRNPRLFNESGRLPHHGIVGGVGGGGSVGNAGTNSNVRSCNCCPYGYHIDLDFVRYCEALANAKPSDEELRRRSKRLSRKSMEFMLGLDNLFDQWDAADRLAQAVPEASQESEPDSPRYATLSTSAPYNQSRIARSASVPRFTYGNSLTRSESPFGTASSTCSSMARGAESDVPYSMRRPAVSPPETRAFLRDALDDVCSDFERTLERTSVRRKKTNNNVSITTPTTTAAWSDRNNNRPFCNSDKRFGNAWDQYIQAYDSCVSGNKSPRSSRSYSRSRTLSFQRQPSPAEQRYESYVQATVAANSKSPVEMPQIPPPPPPRRSASSVLGHTKLLNSPGSSTDCGQSPQLSDKLTSPIVNGNINAALTNKNNNNNHNNNNNEAPINASPADAHTLYNIRQQMALSLKRMKDLEEQVKTIPELQNELSQLRIEKQRLQRTVQQKEDELKRANETANHSSSPSPPGASPKYPSPVQFTPQRISPISLESLGSRIRTSSSSSERQTKSTILKRDVSTNCTQRPTRDIAVGSPVVIQRSVGTTPSQTLNIHENLYTEVQLADNIELAIRIHEERKADQRRKNVISVGTQKMETRQLRENGTQTINETPKLTNNIGVIAKPKTADIFVSCRPLMRSIGCSDDRTNDILCEKCAVRKRSVSCGTNDSVEQEITQTPVSLKQLDMPKRSNTFSLGENEKLNIKRKTIGTQCLLTIVHNVGSQTTSQFFHTIGVQNSPEFLNASTQSFIQNSDKQTDTKGLMRLCTTQTSTEEISKPVIPAPKPQMKTIGSNTDIKNTIENGMNTLPPIPKRDWGSNTDEVHKRDIGCGDVTKLDISIACADNYCDSCKDAVKNLAKDYTKTTATSPLPIRPVDSKIPRPKHLPSPNMNRKQIQRQNTYTITPSPTPSPVAEKRGMYSSLHEKPPINSFHQLETDRKPALKPRSVIVNQAVKEELETSLPLTDNSITNEPLIVREEKRVIVNWSRDSSPAVSKDGSSPRKSLENSFNEKLIEVSNEDSSEQTSSSDVSKGARKKTAIPKSSQAKRVSDEQTTTTTTTAEKVPSKGMLQKLATEESEPRNKYAPSKEMLDALKIINDSLLKKMNAKSLSSNSLKEAKATIQQEWFRISSNESANPHEVEDYIDCFESFSVPMLEYCVNMVDNNGNTAMHYAVSHGNFDVVSILLDSKVCNVNQMNNAGYTCVMLVSLAKLKNSAHHTVVERLFQMADVNIRAKKHCQTALMLAVSHGNKDMVSMLLLAGADVNIQDEDGSTALMCAAEHGRIDIVKLLLSEPDCDSLKQDVDGSTAFRVAWQAGHRDVGLLLYVHEQMLRSKLPNHGEMQQTSPIASPQLPPTS